MMNSTNEYTRIIERMNAKDFKTNHRYSLVKKVVPTQNSVKITPPNNPDMECIKCSNMVIKRNPDERKMFLYICKLTGKQIFSNSKCNTNNFSKL